MSDVTAKSNLNVGPFADTNIGRCNSVSYCSHLLLGQLYEC